MQENSYILFRCLSLPTSMTTVILSFPIVFVLNVHRNPTLTYPTVLESKDLLSIFVRNTLSLMKCSIAECKCSVTGYKMRRGGSRDRDSLENQS